jgi:NAD(P)-dependent dehydrogenase (short-subunit alcohol dehydrogenase family)
MKSDKTLLLIGASRGLGFALAEEYLKRGWRVVATERSRSTSQSTICSKLPAAA